jgi:hypothetical protein
LNEAGFTRQFGETRSDFAKRVAEAAPSFEKLTALHVAARLGDPNRDPEARPELQRQVWDDLQAEFQGELAKKTPLWRRILGLFHPASFIGSR